MTTTRYVKVNVEHQDYLQVIQICNNAFFSTYPDHNLSIRYNLANTACWVKTTTNADLSVGGAVLDIEDDTNIKTRADVHSDQWVEYPT